MGAARAICPASRPAKEFGEAAVARVAVKALAYVILASPDLDPWERFGSDVLGMEPVRRGGDLLLRMATVNGAEALGWADECGSLTPGKSADFVVIPLPDRDADDPYDLWLESKAPPSEVWFRGTAVRW